MIVSPEGSKGKVLGKSVEEEIGSMEEHYDSRAPQQE